MKKITLALPQYQMKIPVIDFACYISRLAHSGLTGVLLQQETFNIIPEPEHVKALATTTAEAHPKYEAKVMEQSAAYFLDACTKRGVSAEILVRAESNNLSPSEELINESRFTDLLVIDPEISFQKSAESVPTDFVKEILAQAECPVLIAPVVFEGIDEVVFCYDGSRSSVFAMKQFTYLFPEYAEKNVVVLEAATGKGQITERDKIKYWLMQHYSHVQFTVMDGDAQDELFTYFLLKKNLFIVMGAYGRGTLSTFFKKSAADVILRVVNLPLFISHV